ncbi:hypothetical protein KDK95_25925 [Actinospica sp. MGRD01-02]|uniref:Uncharacterized protein n=1 Tax=Actinospica acidithermotolerans TaxID=2828514 RepID=A0A941IIL1_9ACTN|nr:hypothetical protein [Actinospica acidithermotolerans]MBR7829770.1 hypothetical protein [Actinospica acidithermotolerans]
MIGLQSVRAAAGYEATRLATRRAAAGVFCLAALGSALATLPAARAAVNSGDPQAHVGWVVAGGTAGRILPATIAVLAAAWLGAGLVTEDYRHGVGLTTYTRLPRRGAGMLGKLIVALVVGIWLAAVTRLAAYLTALGGFALTHGTRATEHISLGAVLMLPTPAESCYAAFGGMLGVLCASVLRLRVLAASVSWLLAASTAAVLPSSHSPYALDVVRGMTDVGLPIDQVSLALPESVAAVLLLAALYAVRRRRID